MKTIKGKAGAREGLRDKSVNDRSKTKAIRKAANASNELAPIIRYFNKLKSKNHWSYQRLHKKYFLRRLSIGTLKTFLSWQGPDQPHAETVKHFKEVYARARMERHPDYVLHRRILDKIQLEDPSADELGRYAGLYRFWREGRLETIEGTIKIERHPKSGIPYHWQRYDQIVDRKSGRRETIHYEGPIFWNAHNLHLLGIGPGYIRNTKLRRSNKPDCLPLVGMYLSEEFGGSNNPFAVKILLLRKDWYERNHGMATPEWIRDQLKNHARKNKWGLQNSLRMNPS